MTQPNRIIRWPLASWSLLVAAAFSAACEQYGATYPTDVELSTLVIHGLLLANEPEQELLIEYARPVGDGYYPGGVTPARIAEAFVETEAGVRYYYQMVADTPGVFRAAFIPRSGERYSLRVQDINGAVATGATIIPGKPVMYIPERDTTLTIPFGMKLTWSAASGAGYIVVYRSLDADRPSQSHFLWLTSGEIQTDTTASPAVGSRLPGSHTTGARIGVAAVDSVYAAYVAEEPWQVVRMSRARSTLQGAYGVFASAALSGFRRVEVVVP